MARTLIASNIGWSFVSGFIFLSGFVLFPAPSAAQRNIISEERFRVDIESVVESDKTEVIRIRGGRRPRNGLNLFYGFEQFDVLDHQAVYFEGRNGVENIFARVIGNNSSEILGTLGVIAENSTNLFLINPNGIIFGPNARLDLAGSFVATTAESFVFSDGRIFGTLPSQEDMPLTISTPIGLQLGRSTGSIMSQSNHTLQDHGREEVTSARLQVDRGETLMFIGGQVDISGGALTAKAGNIIIGSFGPHSDIEIRFTGQSPRFTFRENIRFEDIFLSNDVNVRVSANQAGNIRLYGRNVRMTDGATLESRTRNRDGGEIYISAAESLLVRSTRRSDTQIEELTQIGSDTLGGGDAGDIVLDARRVRIQDGGSVTATTDGSGHAGNVYVNAQESVSLEGVLSIENLNLPPSSIESQVTGDAEGRGGLIEINTGQLRLIDGAQLTTSTRGPGNAGTIRVHAHDLVIEGSNELSTGIFNRALRRVGNGERLFSTGDAGDIHIHVGRLTLQGGGAISASTQTSGNSGVVQIIANELALSGEGSNQAEISSEARVGFTNDGVIINRQTGDASDIFIRADKLHLMGESTITARTQSTGNGGNIDIIASELVAENQAVFTVSGEGSGRAGELNISAEHISLRDSNVFATTRSRGGANIFFNDFDVLLMQNGSEISAQAFQNANGGNVSFTSPNGFITSVANDDNNILASADRGRGGFINIDVLDILGFVERTQGNLQLAPENTQLNILDATSAVGDDGIININTPDIDPVQGTLELPSSFVDVAALIDDDVCRATQGSEFVHIGRGGIPPSPQDVLSDNITWQDWRLIEVDEDRRAELSQTVPSDPGIGRSATPLGLPSLNDYPLDMIREANRWLVNHDGYVELVADASASASRYNINTPHGCF